MRGRVTRELFCSAPIAPAAVSVVLGGLCACGCGVTALARRCDLLVVTPLVPLTGAAKKHPAEPKIKIIASLIDLTAEEANMVTQCTDFNLYALKVARGKPHTVF